MRHTSGIDNLVQDLAYAVRTLRRSPAFVAAAAITLALGIGASTAIFSVTNAVLLQPLPYRNPDRLVLIFQENRAASTRNSFYSNADFYDLRAGSRAIFEDIGGIAGFRAFVPTEDGGTEQIGKALVTTNFFRLMGARVAVGRDFTDADAVPQPAQPDVLIPPGSSAILSYEYWQRRYGGSTAVPGLRAGHLLRDAVVMAEVALSFVLLIGSGLMLRSFVELRRVDPGYRPHGLLTFFVARSWEFSRQQGRLELLRELRARLQALPCWLESSRPTPPLSPR